MPRPSSSGSLRPGRTAFPTTFASCARPEALVDEIGLDGEVPTARRRGRELPAEAPLAELALRHGDEIRFGRAAPASAPATVELVLGGGPEAGRRVPLLPGE